MSTPTHRRGYNDEDSATPRPHAASQAHAQQPQPITDDSAQIDSRLTGPGTDGNPLYGMATQQLAGLQNPSGAPPQTDYTGTYHNITEDDFKQNAAWQKAAGDGWSLGGDISHNDLDRMHFGIAEPAVLKAAQDASARGRQQLEQQANAVNGGDSDAVGTAEEILKAGEPGLKFFDFFAPAYNAWRCGAVSCDTLRAQYQAEYGMSFSAYSADSKTMADLSRQLVSIQQNLDNAYNALVPTWQGDAAANFEAKMSVFFKAAGAVTQDVATSGKDVAALVHGLQQLVLAKAQTVSELYTAELPNGIDAVMAQTLVKVAQGQADKRTCLTAFYLLGGKIDKQNWLEDVLNPFGDLILEAEAAQLAQQMATEWCNNVLVPQFEGREQALQSVNTETKQRIQQGFAEYTKQLSGIKDPFAAMATASAPQPTTPASAGGGGGGRGGGGAGTSSVGGGGSGVAPGGGAPSGGTSSGGGASWQPPAPPSHSTGTDPTTTQSATTPISTPVDPTTGLPSAGGAATGGGDTGVGGSTPTVPTGIGASGIGTSGIGTGTSSSSAPALDPKHDIHTNADGSVSLNPDRGLTISPAHGKKNVFTLTDTDSAGIEHTYHVHFDKHGNPIVHEDVAKQHLDGLDDITTPAADLPSAHPSAGAGIGGGSTFGGGGIAGGGSLAAGGAGAGAAAHHGHSGAGDLAQGAQVGSDNTMGNTMGTAGSSTQTGSPVAGAAAPAQPGQQQGGVSGMPMMGAGMGRGGQGGQEESARRYTESGDLIGEDELEQWQAMGPVIGEQ